MGEIKIELHGESSQKIEYRGFISRAIEVITYRLVVGVGVTKFLEHRGKAIHGKFVGREFIGLSHLEDASRVDWADCNIDQGAFQIGEAVGALGTSALNVCVLLYDPEFARILACYDADAEVFCIRDIVGHARLAAKGEIDALLCELAGGYTGIELFVVQVDGLGKLVGEAMELDRGIVGEVTAWLKGHHDREQVDGSPNVADFSFVGLGKGKDDFAEFPGINEKFYKVGDGGVLGESPKLSILRQVAGNIFLPIHSLGELIEVAYDVGLGDLEPGFIHHVLLIKGVRRYYI